MAEGGETFGEKMSFSKTTGSEPVFDFYCELCKEDGKTIEAEGYCLDCEDYLCKTCFTHHRRSRPTRHHELLDKEKMPKDTPLSHERVSKDISTKCSQHKGEIVKFYCKSHDELGCSTCIAMKHRSCDGIDCIPDKSEGLLDSQEYKEFIKELEFLTQKAGDIIQVSRDNVSKAETYYTAVLISLTKFREDINSILDTLENEIKTKTEAIRSEDAEKMKSSSEKSNCILKKLEDITSDVHDLEASRKVCQLYIAMKDGNREVNTLKTSLSETESSNVVRVYEFKPNEKLKEFMNSPDVLGNISVHEPIRTKTNQTEPKDPKEIKATHVTDIDVKSSSDTSYYITGSAVLSKQKVVVVDYGNCRLKLLDTQAQQLISEIRFPSLGRNVTVVSKDQVAVACGGEKKIRFVKVSDTLTIEREITVDGNCQGIAYSKDRLVVTYVSPARVEIMDLQGKVIRKIVNDNNGSPLFSCPRHVCVSRDDQTIYVSDYSSNKVTSMTFEGKVKSVYSDNELKGPEKVCVDHRGNVYICGYSSKNIHMITPDCVMIKIILTQTDGLTSGLYSVSHCPETDRLFVGLNDNHVKVYQLS